MGNKREKPKNQGLQKNFFGINLKFCNFATESFITSMIEKVSIISLICNTKKTCGISRFYRPNHNT